MSTDKKSTDVRSYIDIAEIIGGDDALAFVAMASRMYQGWAARSGLSCEVIAREPSWGLEGYHQRIKLRIEGADPAILSLHENGVHGLTRMVKTTGRRHMAFIGVRVSDRPDVAPPADRDGWREQIRSFVMDPDPMVVNRLTGFRSARPMDVLAGDLALIWDPAT